MVEGELNGHRCSLPRAALNVQFAVMPFRDPLGDGQAQPGAAHFAGAGLIGAIKRSNT